MYSSSKLNRQSNIITALLDRQLSLSRANQSPNVWSSTLVDKYLDKSNIFYYKDFSVQHGCAKAIEFSPDGEFLASCDNTRILLWNVWQSIDDSRYSPQIMQSEHSANIFCIAFDSKQTHLFTGGSDEVVIIHNIETCKSINTIPHFGDIYGLSVNSSNNNIFASASSDILIWDLRCVPEPSVKLAIGNGLFRSVMYRPQNDNILVTANSRDGIELHDVRKPKQSLFKFYSSTMIKSQSSMYVSFNKSGDLILALRRDQSPVLYNIRSPYPVAEFESEIYSNSCIIKNCSFVGENDQFVASGSDNFKVYIWKIPEHIRTNQSSNNSVIEQVESPQHVLIGHKSIVNQVKYNYTNGIIASAGVEKVIKLWSPIIRFNEDHKVNSRESEMNRNFYNHKDYLDFLQNGRDQTFEENSTNEDGRILAYFDSMIIKDLESLPSLTSTDDDDIEIDIGQENLYESDLEKVNDEISFHEVGSDFEDDLFLIQKTFVFNTKINLSDFEYKDYLKLAYAKRVYIRYFIEIVDNFIKTVKRESFESLRNYSQKNSIDKRAQKLTNVHDIFTLNDKFKSKKRVNLIYLITKVGDSLIKRFATGSMFQKIETKCYEPEKDDLDFSRDNFQEQIKAMSKIKDKKLCDKQLYLLLQKLLKKTVELKKDMLEFKDYLELFRSPYSVTWKYLMNAGENSDSQDPINEETVMMDDTSESASESGLILLNTSSYSYLNASNESSDFNDNVLKPNLLRIDNDEEYFSNEVEQETVENHFDSESSHSFLSEQPQTSSAEGDNIDYNNINESDHKSFTTNREKMLFKKIDRKNQDYKTHSKNASDSKNKKKKPTD